MSALSSYLHKRAGSQYWQVRLTIPKPLRASIGKTEFTASTGKAERKDAETRALAILALWKAEIERVRTSVDIQPCASNLLELRKFAATCGFTDVVQNLDRKHVRAAKKGPSAFGQLAPRLKQIRDEKIRLITAGDLYRWEAVLSDRLTLAGHSVPPALTSELASVMARASIDAYNLGLAKLERTDHDFELSPETRKVFSSNSDERSIIQLFEEYAAQRLDEGRKRADSVAQDRIVVAQFSEILEPGKELRTISKADVKKWLDVAKATPANFRKQKRYAGLSLAQVARLPKDISAKYKSVVTIKREMSALSAFFIWCIENDFLERNPCEHLSPKVNKAKNRRPSYTDDDLHRIFHSPLFKGCYDDELVHIPGEVRLGDWRYWIPIVCLFSGARVGEIAQLRTNDISEDSDGFAISIRHEPRHGQFTKNGTTRLLPMHSFLVQAGFVEFWRMRRVQTRGKDTPLFDGVAPNKRAHYGDSVTRFWGDYLQKIGVKSGADGYGIHSFRHTFADRLRGRYMNDAIGVALGHLSYTTTAGYGSLTEGPVSLLRPIIECLKFPNVDFEHLIQNAQTAKAA